VTMVGDPLYQRVQRGVPSVLNKPLYMRLEQLYGKVKVHKQGEHLREVPAINPVTGKQGKRVAVFGEQYRINCPYCADTTYRCYVNHMFGAYTQDGRQLTQLIKCYNEDCFKTASTLERFKSLVIGILNANSRQAMQFVTTGVMDTSPILRKQPELPGEVMSLTMLERISPKHPAVQYMKADRKYTSEMLDKYQVGYCTHSQKYGMASERIIFPCFKEQALWGWQARYVGKPIKSVPKYYNFPDMEKTAWMYNLDTAKDKDMLVLVEGIPAVHFVGDNAAALLGKTISSAQAELIGRYFKNKVVVLWLDLDAQPTINFQLETIKRAGAIAVNVSPINDLDPADYGTSDAWRLIHGAIAKARK